MTNEKNDDILLNLKKNELYYYQSIKLLKNATKQRKKNSTKSLFQQLLLSLFSFVFAVIITSVFVYIFNTFIFMIQGYDYSNQTEHLCIYAGIVCFILFFSLDQSRKNYNARHLFTYKILKFQLNYYKSSASRIKKEIDMHFKNMTLSEYFKDKDASFLMKFQNIENELKELVNSDDELSDYYKIC